MSVKRVVIAGEGSGVGKTSIATGIMSQLSYKYRVQGFKVGPDFIDPMFHAAATGRPSRNLDSFLMSADAIRNLFGWATRDADIAVIEGVRGLYDGLTATGDVGSTAEVAKILDASVILVINARSLAKSAAAHVLGFKMLDRQVRIEGVILNQISGERHRKKAVEAVESLTGTEVLGAVSRRTEAFPERHLGLITVDELGRSNSMEMAESLADEVDLDGVLAASERHGRQSFPWEYPFPHLPSQGVKVAVPRDQAFCFYYPENLESIEAAGGSVVTFRPTEGEPLPDADAYYLGGGYPEEHLDDLGRNRDFLDGLRNASEEGKTVYAECGGLMSLCDSIEADRKTVPMAGIFPHGAVLTDRRQGLSYVKAKGTAQNPLFPGQSINAHEFHYSHLVPVPIGPFAYDVARGRGIDGRHDGLVVRRTVGTYMHQHALANRRWGEALVESASSGPG